MMFTGRLLHGDAAWSSMRPTVCLWAERIETAYAASAASCSAFSTASSIVPTM